LEGLNYQEYLKMGWTLEQINNQFNKSTNLSFGAFYNGLMISFIFGNLINIEKISEYEILLIYVSKYFRKKGLGTKLLKKIKENKNCLKKIHLEVSKNNLQGISFYKRMGFKNIYTRKNYFLNGNKKIDAFVMLKNY
jgi:ribosomal protein S18 acetylase RimI-like enzyme